jgi:hypothetical protein
MESLGFRRFRVQVAGFRLPVLGHFGGCAGHGNQRRRPQRDDTSVCNIEAGNGFVAFSVKLPEDFSWANGIDA